MAWIWHWLGLWLGLCYSLKLIFNYSKCFVIRSKYPSQGIHKISKVRFPVFSLSYLRNFRVLYSVMQSPSTTNAINLEWRHNSSLCFPCIFQIQCAGTFFSCFPCSVGILPLQEQSLKSGRSMTFKLVIK